MTLVAPNPQDANTPQREDVVLSVRGVSKKFCRDLKRSLLYGVQDIGKELLGLRGEKNDTLRKKEFWALQDVSFELRRGEALGLVGKNGSGKSTLLRIIAGLIKPDTGMVQVNGRVAPLIALGAGFNPVLTGRENIYANMSILGLSKEEIDDRFDEVVEFSEIGEAIDSPVQTYSSGMAARLGFSSAIHTEPDIMLIDEVLAVGDMRFRSKCYRRLAQLSEQSVSFILVSHDANTILSACTSAVLLSKGQLVDNGYTYTILRRYEEELFECKSANLTKASIRNLISHEKTYTGLTITHIEFKDRHNNTLPKLFSGYHTKICLGVKAEQDYQNVGCTLLIKELSLEMRRVLCLSTYTEKISFNVSQGKDEIVIEMPFLGLKPGYYTIKASVSQGSLNILDAIEDYNFKINQTTGMSQCLFYQPKSWYMASHKLSIEASN